MSPDPHHAPFHAQPADPGAAERAQHAERMLRAAIAAADPAPAVRNALENAADLRDVRNIHLLAVGKAAGVMARAALDSLSVHPESVLVIVPQGTEARLGTRARVLHAAHPIPDATSVAAARAVLDQLSAAGAGDLVVVLISGGASSLCAIPLDGITIEQYAALVRALLHAGADIRQLNTVRRHIDGLKGGGMARLIVPARTLGLIISDVVGNPLDIIASGPLTPAGPTAHDAIRVLERHGLWTECPEAVRRVLDDAHARSQQQRDSAAHVDLRVIVDNASALTGAARAAARLGYDVQLTEAPVTGAAREAGARIARAAIDVAHDLQRPVCMVSGGETTVMVQGTGVGGRNQELVLAGAIELRGVRGISIASIGTDGVDGPTDAAGAIADGGTVARGAYAGVDAALALDRNDSHSFFVSAGGLIRTGPTGTNVMDVQVAVIQPPAGAGDTS